MLRILFILLAIILVAVGFYFRKQGSALSALLFKKDSPLFQHFAIALLIAAAGALVVALVDSLIIALLYLFLLLLTSGVFSFRLLKEWQK